MYGFRALALEIQLRLKQQTIDTNTVVLFLRNATMTLMSIFKDSTEGGPRREQALVSSALLAGALLGFLARPLLAHLGLGRAAHDESDEAVSDDENELLDDNAVCTEETKLIFCVRVDLKMTKGKIAAQVGHATLGAYKKARRSHPAILRGWEDSAQPKIALQIRSAAEANQLDARARSLGIPTYKVHDAGRTQIAAVRTMNDFYMRLSLSHYVYSQSFLCYRVAPAGHCVFSCMTGKHDGAGNWTGTQVANR